MGKIYAVGSVNVDVQLRAVHEPEMPGLTLADELLLASGGKAANAAVMARRLGADVSLFGCVGDDELAELALRGPRAAAVDVSAIQAGASDHITPDHREAERITGQTVDTPDDGLPARRICANAAPAPPT